MWIWYLWPYQRFAEISWAEKEDIMNVIKTKENKLIPLYKKLIDQMSMKTIKPLKAKTIKNY